VDVIKMRFGVLGSNNIYVRETTAGFSDFFGIDAIILKKEEEECNIISNNGVNLRYIDTKSVLSLLKLPFTIKTTSKFVDGFIVHYMNLYFALLIASGLIIDKPIAYLCYGGDVHKSKFRNWCVKKALERVDLIFVEVPSQQEYLHDYFGVPNDKLESSKIVFPVNSSFKKYNESQIEMIRKKRNISKKHVIFSPRTIDEHYNHHILIEAVSLLEDSLKKDI
jgi:glycosyltransferase involved in cell wall biosynthesis